MKRKNKWLIIVAVVALAVIIGALLWVNLSRKNHTISYEEFKSLTTKQQVKVFSKMTGQEVYDLVADSDQNWPVTEYDLISPNNAKETIVLKYEDEEPEFDLAWPSYGGFLPETIASLSELTGKMDVSRNGSESGYTMSYGRNKDGSYPSNSQRSIPNQHPQL